MKKLSLLLIIIIFAIHSKAQENPLNVRFSKIELDLKNEYPEIKQGQLEITIFGNNKCRHCINFIEMLSEANIPFIEFDVKIQKNASLMRKLCYKKANTTSLSISYPVVLINNEVYYQIEDLKLLCDEIEKRIKEKR